MAVKFTAANSDYLEIDSTLVGGYPFTMSCLFRAANDTSTVCLICLPEKGDASKRYSLRAAGEIPGDPIEALADDGVVDAAAQSTTGYDANIWSSAIGVIIEDDDRAVYFDGANKETETTRVEDDDIGIDRFTIGCRSNSTRSLFFDGDIAEVGVWNVALTDAEISMLADGFAPSMIRFNSLVSYWPLIDDYRDEVGTNHLTAGGTPQFSEHPPGMVYPPERRRSSVKQHQRRTRGI